MFLDTYVAECVEFRLLIELYKIYLARHNFYDSQQKINLNFRFYLKFPINCFTNSTGKKFTSLDIKKLQKYLQK